MLGDVRGRGTDHEAFRRGHGDRDSVVAGIGIHVCAPGAHERARLLMESEQAMFPWMLVLQGQPEFQIDATPFFVVGAVAGLIGITIPLYFLITRKFAFEKAAAELRPGTPGVG